MLEVSQLQSRWEVGTQTWHSFPDGPRETVGFAATFGSEHISRLLHIYRTGGRATNQEEPEHLPLCVSLVLCLINRVISFLLPASTDGRVTVATLRAEVPKLQERTCQSWHCPFGSDTRRISVVSELGMDLTLKWLFRTNEKSSLQESREE